MSAGRERAGAPDAPVVLAAGIPVDLLVLLVFFFLPVLGRALRGLQERAEKEAREKEVRRGGSRPAPRQRPLAGADPGGAEDLERRGAEVWRRLLEGIDPEGAQRAPVPAPEPVPREVAPPRPERTPPAAPAPLPMAAAPAPAPVAAAPAAEPAAVALAPLADAALGLEGVLEGTLADALEPEADAPVDAALPPARRLGARGELWRAVLWSEILAPPLALREPESGPRTTPWHLATGS